jgi:hypothetical protein
MFEKFIDFYKYIYEKFSERYNNLVIDEKRLLEENTFYCRMMDGDFSLKTDKKINDEKNEKQTIIQERMETYRK